MYTCDCGAAAQEWAYLGGDPNEMFSPITGCAFSLRTDLYAAMCKPCHREMDAAHITSCPQGHEYTPANTIREGRKRKCRKCHYRRNHQRPLSAEQKQRKIQLQRERRSRNARKSVQSSSQSLAYV